MRLLLPLVLLGCSTVRADAPRGEPLDGLWVLQIRRQAWQPRDLEFVVRFEEDGSRSMATVDPVFIGRTIGSVSDVRTTGDRVAFTVHSRMDDNVYRFEAEREGGTIDGVVRWNDDRSDQVEPFTGYRRDVRRFDTTIDGFEVEADPREVGVEPVLLDRLVLGAEVARSDALLVLSDGRLIAARTFGAGDAATRVGSLSAAIGSAANLSPSEIAAQGQAYVDNGPWSGGALFEPLPDPTDDQHAPLGYGARTREGEALLVYPEARLVVVRTVHRVPNQWDRRYDTRDRMEWLPQMAESIAVEKLERPPRPR